MIKLQMKDDCLNYWGDHTVKYRNVKSLYCIPETNVTDIRLHTNYKNIFISGKHYAK